MTTPKECLCALRKYLDKPQPPYRMVVHPDIYDRVNALVGNGGIVVGGILTKAEPLDQQDGEVR